MLEILKNTLDRLRQEEKPSELPALDSLLKNLREVTIKGKVYKLPDDIRDVSVLSNQVFEMHELPKTEAGTPIHYENPKNITAADLQEVREKRNQIEAVTKYLEKEGLVQRDENGHFVGEFADKAELLRLKKALLKDLLEVAGTEHFGINFE